MKDIVITEKQIKRELKVLAGCFVFAVLFNLFSIIKYHRPFTELFQTIGYEIVITLAVYLILAIIRLIIAFARKLVCRKAKK